MKTIWGLGLVFMLSLFLTSCLTPNAPTKDTPGNETLLVTNETPIKSLPLNVENLSTETIPVRFNLSIIKSFNLNTTTHLSYDGESIWGFDDSALIKLNTTTGEKTRMCKFEYGNRGLAVVNNSIWIVGSASVYRIDRAKCANNILCEERNHCILAAWNLGSTPEGLTSDGEYLYTLEKALVKYDFNLTLRGYDISNKPRGILHDITWDGASFWILSHHSFSYTGMEASWQPSYYKIYHYDRDFNLLGESDNLEMLHPAASGITHDGEFLWISSNSILYQAKIQTIV